MRQVSLLALMMTFCITLCSCEAGQTIEEKAAKIQAEYATWEQLDITAHISADYGDRVYDFKLQFTGNETEGTVKVLSPEEIAGLTAELTPDSSYLIFDGAELSLGALTADGLSPMSCLPMMLGQWSGGYIDNAETASVNGADALSVSFTVSDNIYLITWFELSTSLPLKAELYLDGSMIISCEFENIVT